MKSAMELFSRNCSALPSSVDAVSEAAIFEARGIAGGGGEEEGGFRHLGFRRESLKDLRLRKVGGDGIAEEAVLEMEGKVEEDEKIERHPETIAVRNKCRD